MASIPHRDLERSSKAARTCADALIALRPAWAFHLRLLEFDSLDWPELVFPNDASIGPLEVEFDADEITIFVGRYHCHHFSGGNCGDRSRQVVARTVEAILGDALLVASVFAGDRWLGTGLIDKSVAEPLCPAEGADCALTIQSWSGRYDRTFPAIRTHCMPLFDLRPGIGY